MSTHTLRIFSRHGTHSCLRNALKFPVLVCMRLGSITKGTMKYCIEINSPEAVSVSANKWLMKEAFTKAKVKTAKWWYAWTPQFQDEIDKGIPHTTVFMNPEPSGENGGQIIKPYTFDQLPYPIIAKHIHGSRGTGNYKLDTKEALQSWVKGKDMRKYIFEAFFKHGREYRLHVTREGCFYACRKLLKNDATETWHRHDSNCIWAKEDNPSFDKPVNWDAIVSDCVKALTEIGLDVGAFDVKVQTSKNKDGVVRTNPDYILIESCSAPSFGEVTKQKYLEIIPKIVEFKTKK